MRHQRAGSCAPLHQAPIKAHFNEGRLITAAVTDARLSASDANLCLGLSGGHNQSERKISDRTKSRVEAHSSPD